MLANLALAAIRGYQRHLSPRKGYACAYRLGHGGVGCSGFGKHAIGKHGLVKGLFLLRRRLDKCAWQAGRARQALEQSGTVPRAGLLNPTQFHRQGGFIDCDIGGCDVPGCDMPSCSRFAGRAGGVGNCLFDAWGCWDNLRSRGSSSAVHREQSRRERRLARRAKPGTDAGPW